MIDEYNNIKNHYAVFWLPEITYFPNDNTELTIGIKYLDGKRKLCIF